MKKEIDNILAEMFPEYDIEASDDAKDEFWENLTEKQTYDVNHQHLLATHDPQYDYLVCWEPGRFGDDEQVTDYNNFYEIDKDWWEFQKQAQWDSIEDMKKWMENDPKRWSPETVANSINRYNKEYENGYSMYMSGDWYRLIDNGVFLYSQFISAKWYLYYLAEYYLDDLQEEHIPYTFRDDDFLNTLNENDPTKRYKANGRELELDSYKTKIREYQSNGLIDYLDFLVVKYKRVFSGKTFRFDKGYEEGEDFDPFTDFIFYDEESLLNVSPKDFLKTFNSVQVSFDDFNVMIEEMKIKVKENFDLIYNENKSKFN